MPSGVSLEIVPSELAQIVESVFAAMLGVEVSECHTPWFPGVERLTSEVTLEGDWNGVVLLECDRAQACRFAELFLAKDTSEPQTPAIPGDDVAASEVGEDVVWDLMGELANMIGGNIKCVLTHPIRLSMPVVVKGIDYRDRVKDRLSFECTEGVFWVAVLALRR